MMLVGLLPAAFVVATKGRSDRLVALELATVMTSLLLVLLAEGLDRPSYYDLAIMLSLLAFPGTLAFAVTLERWL